MDTDYKGDAWRASLLLFPEYPTCPRFPTSHPHPYAKSDFLGDAHCPDTDTREHPSDDTACRQNPNL